MKQWQNSACVNEALTLCYSFVYIPILDSFTYNNDSLTLNYLQLLYVLIYLITLICVYSSFSNGAAMDSA